jgi:hypothetical protein
VARVAKAREAAMAKAVAERVEPAAKAALLVK